MIREGITSCPAVIYSEDKRDGKLLTTFLLGLTYLILGCVQKLPSSTVSLLGAQLGPSQEKIKIHMMITFSIRQMGYICGFVCGGAAFDYFILPMEKQVMISFMLVIMALSCLFLPFFTSMLRIGIVLFISGVSMTFVSTGINTYVMDLYGVNSNTGIQFIYAWNLLGKFITYMATRIDYQKFSISPNITVSYENRREVFTKLFISYSTLGAFITLLALAWICLYRFSPREYQSHVPFDDSRQEKTTLGFQTLAVVTTVPMLISAAFLDFVYELLIRTYATNKLGRTVRKHENVISFYYISMVLGRQIAIVIAYKLLTPSWMISLDLLVQLFAACLMPLLHKFEDTLLWVVTGLVGLSSASLVPSTLAWLNSHIMITGKIIGSMYAASIITLMTVPIWLDETLLDDPEAPLYYMLLVPLFYATIFAIQIFLFRRERNLKSAIQESSDSQQIRRILETISRQGTHTGSRAPGEIRRAYTVP
ncbi:hypothetical protein AVEN_138435-1 [Araneus ventricosus]|uniref:Sodium-dependent glucose transporter 1 n=1 Tax=Araneus ventricosus TaxID=182803 RepID=A0A4Y2CES5_ARAVE|nr:hypothetical protein AVEN_138435-1 [Araneus ventricosus]